MEGVHDMGVDAVVGGVVRAGGRGGKGKGNRGGGDREGAGRGAKPPYVLRCYCVLY